MPGEQTAFTCIWLIMLLQVQLGKQTGLRCLNASALARVRLVLMRFDNPERRARLLQTHSACALQGYKLQKPDHAAQSCSGSTAITTKAEQL